MKKSKIVLIILVILLGIILLDTFQAKVFDNSPLLKIRETFNGGETYYIDKGLLVNYYRCNNFTESTVWKTTKYACPINNIEENKSKEDDQMNNINLVINNQKYLVTIEDNDTAKEFLNHIPEEFNMSELNGNEKYIYMDYSLPTDSKNPQHIKAGDIMLYGNNCLVIFYKSFDTSYSYTKIGHIDNLPDLGNNNITVKFEK